MNRLLILVVVLLSSATISKADTVITVTENLPNPGDTSTTTVTYNTSFTTTGNLISQDFTDGTWSGTNQATRHGNGTIAGVHGRYVETEVSQADGGLSNSLSEGFTSKLAADIWFWNSNEQSVIMSQAYTNDVGETTTQTKTVSSNATTAYTNYQDIMIIGANTSTNGSVKVRFDFTHEITSGHRAADIKNPELSLTYGTTTNSSSTAIEYCWQKTPSTCPAAVEEVAETIEVFENDLINIIEFIETPEIELVAVPDIVFIPEVIKVTEPTVEIYEPEPMAIEPVPIEIKTEPIEIVADVPIETAPTETFNQEEFVDAYNTETIMEEPAEPAAEPEAVVMDEEPGPEPEEEVAMVEPKPEPDNGEVVGEETMPVQEAEAVPVQEEEVQEETIKEEEAVVEAEPQEEVEEPVEENTEPERQEITIDVAAVEQSIANKIKDETLRVSVTLEVVNELLSREMTKGGANLASYGTINQALFDNRQLPSGNLDFFNQGINLVGYDRTIYNNQVSLGANDPITNHNIELKKASDASLKAYLIYKEKLNELNGI